MGEASVCKGVRGVGVVYIDDVLVDSSGGSLLLSWRLALDINVPDYRGDLRPNQRMTRTYRRGKKDHGS